MRWIAPPLLALLLSLGLRAQQPGIEGVAIDAVTRQPMAGVHITLQAGREDADRYGAISRPDGHFSIAGVKPGTYVLIAQHNGYLQLPDKNSTITIKTGERVQDVTVELTRNAVIVGHVLDEYGDPVRRVSVSAEPASPGKGNPNGAMGMVMTDDRGEFRLALPPGKYYLKTAMLRISGISEIRTDGVVPPVYSPTFYPGATTSDKATAIELVSGQSLAGIDIHLASGRSVTIRGTVTGMPADAVGAPAYVVLRSINTTGMNIIHQPAFTQPDGTFVIAGLTPGKYRLTAQTVAGAHLQSNSVDVDAEIDETTVQLTLSHGETLAGTVEFDGETSKPGAREKLGIRLIPDTQFGANQGANVGEDGTFRIDGVFPGKFRLKVTPLPENAYVKSIKAGANEAENDVLDLSRGVAGVELHIILSRKGGHVEGGVLAEDGQPFTRAAVVFLTDSADTIDENTTKELDAGEKFSYSGLHPGKYKIMVIDPSEIIGGQDTPNALKALLAHAEEIEIHEGDRISKDLKISAKQ